MKLSKLMLAAILMSGTVAFAQENEISDAEIQQTYAIQCGSLEEVGQAVGQDISAITVDEKKELIEMRRTTFGVLVGGEQAIQELLSEGNKNDTGAFGVILACGLIDQIGAKVSEKGCVNLENGETTKGEAGIKACKSVVDALKAKQK